MRQRALGRTGLSVAPIGLGTVALGRAAGLKLAKPVRIPTDDDAVALFRTASELGVNLIDTAPAYGTSEERLGRLLTLAAPRESWVICTKVGEEFDAAAAGGGDSRYDFAAGAIAASVDRSLVRLRVAALDLVLLHFSGATDDAAVLERGEALGALEQAKRAGKVRAVGASVATVRCGMLAVERGCDVVMVNLNAAEQTMLPVVEAARAMEVGVLVKKALGSGRLGVESLRSVLGVPGVSCSVIGTTSPTHLREAVAEAG